MRILANLNVVGTLDLDSVANAGVDTDRFLVQDANGVVRYRTGAEVASDIGSANLAASVLKHQVKLGEAIAKGQAVYVSSSDGTNMIVSKASNASESTSSKTLGLLETGGALNAQVNVITEGLLAGLDTSTANAGDPVWLGTNGNLIFGLPNKPYAPAHLVFIGIVTRVQQINGEIFIKPQNGFELKEIHDVQITTTPADNTVLSYENSSSLYKMKSIATLLGYTPANAARNITINGTTYDLTADRTWNVGTVTSIGVSVPTGLAVSNTPITGAGTIAISLAAGYSIPTTASQSNWDTAYGWGNHASAGYQVTSQKGQPNGYASLDGGGKVPSTQLPSYVDDVLEYANLAGFPGTGETGKIYVALDNNKIYRWSGTAYIEISPTVGTVWGTITGTLSNQTDLQSALDAKVPTSRTITINGTALDLSANRSWTVGDVRTDGSYANPAWITSLAWSKITGAPAFLTASAGTTGTLAKFGASSTLTDSIIREVSGRLLIGAGTTDDSISVIQTNGQIKAVTLTLDGAVNNNTNLWIKSVTGYLGQILYMNNSNMTFALRDNATYWDVYSYVTGSTGQKLIVYANGTIKLPGYTTNGILKTSASDGTLIVDTTTYLTGNQTITLSGDATGSGTTSIGVTLANSGVTAGTYTKVTVDAKGRVTSGTTLSAGDIPTLNYVAKSGDTMTGQLNVHYASGRISVGNGTDNIIIGAWDGTNQRLESNTRPIYIVSYGGTISLGRSGGNTLVADTTSLTWGGAEIATRTWVQSQGYLTSVSDVWVNNSGDSMTGNLSFGSSGAGITWAANTDGASITFESTGDGASGGRALSNLLIALSDNGDEGLKVTSASAELLYINTNQFQYKGNTIWHAGNDGSGSGLDADLLDGVSSASFLRSDVVDANLTGTILSTNNANVDGANFEVDTTNKTVNEYAYKVSRSGSAVGGILIDGRGAFASGTTVNGSTVWHQGNLTNLNQLTNGPGYITSYTETDTLATVTGRGASTNTFVSLLGGSRIVVQNSTDGGNNRGIFMWNTSDTNWGIYMSTAGASKSLANGTAPTGIDGSNSHHIRFRIAGSSGNGFIWENHSEQTLMSVRGDNGNLYIRGQIYAGNSTTNQVWHSGNLTNLNQLSNGPGYITSSGSISGSAGSLSDDSGYIRTRSGGTEANLDTYVDNGVRSIAFTGYSQHLLSWNVGGSPGTIQQLFHYNTPSNGWRIRNKTDNNTWSSWGYVVMSSSNQGLISGTIATQSWVTSQGYATGGPFLPLSGGNATGWVSFSSSTQGTPIIKAIQQDTGSGYYLFQGVTGSSEVFRVDRVGDIYMAGNLVATRTWVQSQGYITGSYLPLSGGTMSGKMLTVSTGTGTYDTAIEIRETGYAGTGQSAWGYSPAMTFHWGGRYAKRFGMRSDGLFAIDDEPIALRSWVTSQGYITGYTDTLATVTGRGASTSTNVTFSGNITNTGTLFMKDSGPSIYENRINAGWNSTGDTVDLWINYEGYQNSTSYFRDFRVGNGKQGNAILFIDGSEGTAAFSGAVTIGGNTVLHAGNYTSYALNNNTDSEQTVGGRVYYFNEGAKRMNMDPRWNESGYDADLGTLHIWAWTAAGAAYGRAGIALYNGSAYQYLTTKASTTGMFINNTQVVTNSGTWGINITGNAATASNSSAVNGISVNQIFNNMGNNHGTYTNFNSIPNFGVYYVQGTTNGPGTGAGQFYGFTLGLGNEYAYASYAMQVAFPRWESASDRYISMRTRENGTWGSWQKAHAGYADSAGALSSMNISQFTNNSGYITSSGSISGSAGSLSGQKYNISDTWFRDLNDDQQVQFYGNSRTMIYRTDGNTNDHGGGGYAHIFYYGGSSDGNRRFIINTDGRLWSSYHGWLDDTFAPKSTTGVISPEYNTSVGSDGWYTIASYGSGRAVGTFHIWDSDSSRHNYVEAKVNWSYGYGGVTVVNNGRHGVSTIKHIRLLYNTSDQTYGGVKVQVYCENAAWTLRVRREYPNDINGWGAFTQIGPTLENTPSGWAEYARASNVNERGAITTSNSTGYLGGNIIWHAGNDGSGSGLDADTVDGYHASNFLGFNGNSYYQASNWIQFNTSAGLYWPSYNGAHIYANQSNYGSIKIEGSRNGWYGIEFGNGVNLMMNTNEVGFHNNNYGWQMRWADGTIYCHKNSYGGGTSATVLDTSNYSSWAQPKLYQGQSAGDWQNFTNDVGEFRVDEVLNITSGSHSNYPTGVYTYGGVMSWRLNNHSFQLYASHTGDLAYKTQWGNDNYSGWRRILDSSNYPYAANMNQYVRTSDGVTFANVSANDVYTTGGWFRNHTNNNGIYWSNTGWHLYPYDANDFYMRSGSNESSIRFLRSDGTVLGYVHNASDFTMGFLTSSRSWRFHVTNSGAMQAYGPIRRSGHSTGFLEGSYNNVGGNSFYSNPIYTIGSSYNPTDSSLSNMYGIGYSHPNFWGIGKVAGWGLYVCSAGVIDAIIGGDGASTSIWAKTDIVAYSDARVKENVEVVENALEKIQAIRGVTFTRNDVKDTKKRSAGVIAQEVLPIFPEVVTGSEEDMYSVAYGNMAALFIEAIKEQQKQIEELKAQINGSSK